MLVAARLTRRALASASLLWPCCCLSAVAAAAGSSQALVDMPLDELLRVEVVSASLHARALQDNAAAVYVITRDDILRSGVRSLPEALRLAPGVDAAQLSSMRWAIGVRGDAGRFSNKLQVLVDGRSLYSPHYAGVFWEAEHLPLEDIERIEVIRGPAGAVWGTNAVNGVVNVITRRATATRGTAMSTQIGSDGAQVLNLRHSTRLNPKTGATSEALRWYAQGLHQAGWEPSTQARTQAAGAPVQDGGHHGVLGMRYDRERENGQRISVQTHVGRALLHDTWWLPDMAAQPLRMQALSTAQSITDQVVDATLLQPLNSRSTLRAQLGYQSTRAGQRWIGSSYYRQWDADLSHRYRGDSHEMTVGLGARRFLDDLTDSVYVQFEPERRTIDSWRLYAQDDWTLHPDWLATVGVRLDHHPDIGTATQPSASLLWRASPRTSTWIAIGRAVRLPYRGEKDAVFNAAVAPANPPTQPLPLLIRSGDMGDNVREKLVALSAGWRRQWRSDLSTDLSLFEHRYQPLAMGDAPTQVQLSDQGYLVGSSASVARRVRTQGLELASDWRPTPTLRTQIHWSWLRLLDTPTATQNAALFRSPAHLIGWRQSWDLAPRWQLDAWLRYTAKRDDLSAQNNDTPAQTWLDLNLRWRARRDMVISMGARHLGPQRATEMNADNGFAMRTQVERAAVLKAELQW